MLPESMHGRLWVLGRRNGACASKFRVGSAMHGNIGARVGRSSRLVARLRRLGSLVLAVSLS